MPYAIKKEHGGFFVVNEDTGQKKNKQGYPTRSQALRLLRALYANEPEAKRDSAKG